MIKPRVDHLLQHSDSHYAAVVLAARRARQINSYFNQLGDGLGHMVPPQVSSVARKPLSIAFEEIAAGKIRACDLPEEAELGEDDVVFVEMSPGEFEVVVCAGLLERTPTADLDGLLQQLRGISARIIFQISTCARALSPDEATPNCTVRYADWWRPKLRQEKW